MHTSHPLRKHQPSAAHGDRPALHGRVWWSTLGSVVQEPTQTAMFQFPHTVSPPEIFPNTKFPCSRDLVSHDLISYSASINLLHCCLGQHLLTHCISLSKCQGAAGAGSPTAGAHMGAEELPSTSPALTNGRHPTWPERSQEAQTVHQQSQAQRVDTAGSSREARQEQQETGLQHGPEAHPGARAG